MKTLNYILGGIIIALLTLIGVLYFEKRSAEKAFDKLSVENSVLKDKWNKLINTPPRVIRVRQEVEVNHSHPVTPTPIPDEKPTPSISQDSCKSNRYNETYTIGDTIHVYWTARTRGIITEFNILKIKYPTYTTTIERFIPCEKVDTASIRKGYSKITWHVGVYGGIWGRDFKVFPNLQGGFYFTFKDKWGLMPGCIYDLQTGKPYWSVNIMLNLK